MIDSDDDAGDDDDDIDDGGDDDKDDSDDVDVAMPPVEAAIAERIEPTTWYRQWWYW